MKIKENFNLLSKANKKKNDEYFDLKHCYKFKKCQ